METIMKKCLAISQENDILHHYLQTCVITGIRFPPDLLDGKQLCTCMLLLSAQLAYCACYMASISWKLGRHEIAIKL